MAYRYLQINTTTVTVQISSPKHVIILKMSGWESHFIESIIKGAVYPKQWVFIYQHLCVIMRTWGYWRNLKPSFMRLLIWSQIDKYGLAVETKHSVYAYYSLRSLVIIHSTCCEQFLYSAQRQFFSETDHNKPCRLLWVTMLLCLNRDIAVVFFLCIWERTPHSFTVKWKWNTFGK